MNPKKPMPKVRLRFVIGCILLLPPLIYGSMHIGAIFGWEPRLPFLEPPRTVPSNFWKIVAWNMPVAWFDFVQRVWPRIRAEPSGIALCLVCAVIAGGILHVVARKFTRAWGWRSTLVVLMLPAVLFAIILCTGGASGRFAELREDTQPISTGFNIQELLELDDLESQYPVRVAPK